LAHLQGGEVSGNIDDRVRHSITKLADIHFPSSEDSRRRVISLGEDPDYVFNFGCPSIDVLCHDDLGISNDVMQPYAGVGHPIDWGKPYMLVVQHPVTTSYGKGMAQITETLEALKRHPDLQKVVLWPNIDAGSDDVSKGIRHFREFNMDEPIYYYKNFSPEDYARVLNNAVCCIGNSSSFIREGAFLGVPAVLVGDRQEGREHGPNILHADYARADISEKVASQLRHGRHKSAPIFGKGDAGTRIAAKLAELDLRSVTKKKLS
jgi:UDP-hydrolysing UDP-N-acetyl-D-glucosamine 2-epimerase